MARRTATSSCASCGQPTRWNRPSIPSARWAVTEAGRSRNNGFFRVHTDAGRWVFVDPHGHPFYSAGMDLVGYKQGSFATDVTRREFLFEALPPPGPAWLRPAAHVSFYTANIMKRFGEAGGSVDGEHHRAPQELGLQHRGELVRLRRRHHRGMPYVLPLSGWTTKKMFPFPWDFPDVFSEGVRAKRRCRREAPGVPLRDDPNLIGWFVGNEPHWARSFGSLKPWPDMLLADPEPSATQAKLARCSPPIPARSSRSRTSFSTPVPAGTSRSSLPPSGATIRTTWCSASASPRTPTTGGCELSRIFDVFSVNIYSRDFMDPVLVSATRGSGRPVLIGEFTAAPRDAACRGSSTTATRCATTPNAARLTATMWRIAAADPYIVGTHWFQMVDDLPTGRPSDQERLNYGFLNVVDLPYPDLVNAARETHRRMYRLNAWAQSGRGTIGGVVIDETGGVMPQVAVTATHQDTNVSTTVTSNDQGLYSILNLPDRPLLGLLPEGRLQHARFARASPSRSTRAWCSTCSSASAASPT
jgi:hypothetical protein